MEPPWWLYNYITNTVITTVCVWVGGWIECNLLSAFSRQALVKAEWLMIAFDSRLASMLFTMVIFSTGIDPSVYFHTVMDGIVPLSPLLVQIITNRYILKTPHQTIILTHDLCPPVPHCPSHVPWLTAVPPCTINQSNQLKTFILQPMNKRRAVYVAAMAPVYFLYHWRPSW